MARSGAVLLCAIGAAVLLAAAVAFVGSPAGPQSRSPRLRSADLSSRALPNGLADVPGSSEEPAEEQSHVASFFKFLSAGLLAGVVMAATSSAPVDAAGLPGGYTIRKSKVLEPCKDNKRYHKKIKDELYKLGNQQKKYAPGSAVSARFTKKIAQVKQREIAYGDRFCGKKDGWPRTIATGEADVRGSAVWPALIFLYIAPWIGWAGRSYLMRTQDELKERNIDVPLALTCMASGFSWPVAAWQEIVDGDFAVPDNQIHTSGFLAK
jgi:photosystem I subunit 3